MKRLALITLLLPLLVAPGCPRREIEVRMERTRDGKVRRELKIWVANENEIEPPEADMVEWAQAAYVDAGETLRRGDRFVAERFTGEFLGVLPADLAHKGQTSYGLYETCTTPMGTVFGYAEQMPGTRNPLEVARAGIKLVDTLVRALVAYAKDHSELWGGPDKLEKLTQFLQGGFRDDLLNAALLGWHAMTGMNDLQDAAAVEDDGRSGMLEAFGYGEAVRGTSYLVEHGYLRPAELLQLSENPGRALARGLLGKIAGVLGSPPDGPLPPGLEKFRDPAELGNALQEGLRLIGASEEDFGNLTSALAPDFGIVGPTEGTIVWRCKTQPFKANGTWDGDQGEVRWQGIGRSGCALPQVLFAFWAEPNDAFQREHFGQTLLVGEKLAMYASWRAGLSNENRTAWEAVVNKLRPGAELRGTLKRFRFAPPTTMPSTAPSQPSKEPERGAALLLEALPGPHD